FLIDVVCYRRHEHNEGDEPAYTQPLLYERIKRTPTVRQRYAEQLGAKGVQNVARAEAEAGRFAQRLSEIQQSLRAHLSETGQGQEPQRISDAHQPSAEPTTAVAGQILSSLNEQLLAVPAGFSVNPKLLRQLERRRGALTEGGTEWAHA